MISQHIRDIFQSGNTEGCRNRCVYGKYPHIRFFRFLKIIVGDILVEAVEAYNTDQGSSTRKIHHKGKGVGYLITVQGRRIYHADDTDFIPEMMEIEDLDVALLPIGGRFTMDIEEAVEAAIAIKPNIVIPRHHLKASPQEFKDKLETRSDVRAIAPSIGKTYRLTTIAQ